MLLYSTNAKIKFVVQNAFYGDLHYVWCSDHFDSRNAPRHTLAAHTGSTSDPLHIYTNLRSACGSNDVHFEGIAKLRAAIVARARKSAVAGGISKQELEDISTLAKRADSALFQPQIYVIPSRDLGNRIKEVPLKKRAGLGKEYIIEDLRSCEFHIIEGL